MVYNRLGAHFIATRSITSFHEYFTHIFDPLVTARVHPVVNLDFRHGMFDTYLGMRERDCHSVALVIPRVPTRLPVMG